MTETIRFWCIVHRSPAEWETNSGDILRCWWDQLVGPRPGRGECSFREAVVTVRSTDE